MKNEVAGIVFDPGRRHVILMRKDTGRPVFEFPSAVMVEGSQLLALSSTFEDQTGLEVEPERWRKVCRLDVRGDRRIHFYTAAISDMDFDMAGVFRMKVNDLALMAAAAPVLWLVFLALDQSLAEPVVVKRN